jgi:hypothetical protein
VGHQLGAAADLHVFANDRERADLHILSELSA